MKRAGFDFTIILLFTLVPIGIILYIIFTAREGADISAAISAFSMFGVLGALMASVFAAVANKRAGDSDDILFRVERNALVDIGRAGSDMPIACEGRIVPTTTMEAPVSGRECVYFHVIRERLESQGKHSAWIVRENVAHYAPFHVEDKSGSLRIDLMNMDNDFSKYVLPLVDKSVPNPKNSEIDAICTTHWKEYKVDKRFAFDEKWRVSEYLLEPWQEVFVYGFVFDDKGEKVLREKEDYPLLISRKSREEYLKGFEKGRITLYAANIFLTLAILYFFSAVYFGGAVPMSLLVLLVGLSIVWGHLTLKLYNRLIVLKERVRNAGSEIHIQLKKRADLVPRLAEIVKAYSKHESEVQGLLAEMRRDLIFYPLGEEKKTQLIGVIEHYPKLKANENFLSLMQTLENVEENVAHTREFYNRSVLKYNNMVEQFPSNIIAKISKMRRAKFLDKYELE